MWHRKTLKDSEAVPFAMPVITSECVVGRNLDQIERDAYEQGYQAGEKAGIEMGMQKGRVILEKIESMLKEITGMRARIIKDLETQCVELSIALGKKLALDELSAKPEIVAKTVREALMKLERSGRITIRVHPSLKELFVKYTPQLMNVHPEIALETDPALPQFGAVVTGPTQEIATDLDEQIKNIIREMAQRRRED